MNKGKKRALKVLLAGCIVSSGGFFNNLEILAQETSWEGVELIKGFEGIRYQAYQADESETYYTIGYGHYGSDVYEDMQISEWEAEQMLLSDLSRFEYYLNAFLDQNNIVLSQAQYDALISLTYNAGNIWAYPDFSLKTILMNGAEYYSAQEIRDAFGEWVKNGYGQVLDGLVYRRSKEADLFLSGTMSVTVCFLYNPSTGENLYTASQQTAAWLESQGWINYGVVLREPLYSDMPVYEAFHPETLTHCYTSSAEEYEYLLSTGWQDRSIAFYSDGTDLLPIYI